MMNEKFDISRRKIRLFVSSTFNDMALERDYLAQFIFPRITDYCMERGIDFLPIDLRWGITREESEANETVALCLDEIDSSYPFFIGLAGARYGWMPSADQLPERINEFTDKNPWLAEKLKSGCSITELEFLYGAIHRAQNDTKAAFYLKDVKDDECDPHQLRLRRSLETQTRFPMDRFGTPEELGEKIYAYLTAFVDRTFPSLNGNEKVIRRQRHEVALNTVLDGYISLGARDEATLSELDEWVSSGSKFAAILGYNRIENGREVWRLKGTSMLLCRFVDRLRRVHDINVEYFDMRLAGSGDRSPIDELTDFISSCGPDVKILALDNLNIQLDEDADRLIKCLLDTRPDLRILMAVSCAWWTQQLGFDQIYYFKLQKPAKEELARLAEKYLRRYGKKLTASQIEILVTNNDEPGSLMAALHALVRFGDFNRLDDEVKRYSYRNLFECLIVGLRENVGNLREGNWEPMWILNAIGLSDVAGLSEREIISLTGITPMRWAQIRRRVAELCQFSGNRYVLDNPDTNMTHLVNHYYTNFRDIVGATLKRWVSDNNVSEARKAVIIPNVYLNFIGAEESLVEEFSREFPSVFTDVDFVNRMPFYLLVLGWRRGKISVGDLEKPWMLRLSVRQYSTDELENYYVRLLRIPYVSHEYMLKQHIVDRLIELISRAGMTDESVLRIVDVELMADRFEQADSLVSVHDFKSSDAQLAAVTHLTRYAFENGKFESFHDLYERFSVLTSDKTEFHTDADFDAMAFMMEYELLGIYYDSSDTEEMKRKVIESEFLTRIEAPFKHFHSKGQYDARLARVCRLAGYANMMSGNYESGMRRGLDPAVGFAGRVYSTRSKEYARALMDYAIGFMTVGDSKNANSHFSTSAIWNYSAESLLNPWIFVGLTTIASDLRFSPENRNRASSLAAEIDRYAQ